ncbi:MAG TPA: hypothetical protein DC064_10620 [Cyanobacteria bacterium UBA9273]|nr:hypothetical protein [Cyanobacteria bacterium UBA9273]
MRLIRILIVTHAPLSAEFGAGQAAINLAEAFREQGHDVTLWSPHPLPPQTRWWQTVQQMQAKLDSFIETQKPFDLIDSPATLITRKVSQSAIVVARSVQPDILYLINSLNDNRERSFKGIIKLFFSYLYSAYRAFLVLQGWSRARYILCLGTLELQWMEKWFPWWKDKLSYYVNALSKTDQEALAQVRLQRQPLSGDSIRFLWIGRWNSHKGTDKLLDFITQWVALRPQDTFTIAGCGIEVEQDVPPKLIQCDQLKIIPSFDRNYLCSLLASHNVGLFTSKVEGWGLVLNEIIESGIPVFTTPAGGAMDLEPLVKGKLMPFPPPLDLTPDLLTILTNREITDDYYRACNWQNIANKYAELVFRNSNYNYMEKKNMHPLYVPYIQENWKSFKFKHALFQLLGLRGVIAGHTKNEEVLLDKYAKGRKSIVELGVAEGASALALRRVADSAGNLYLIDPYLPGRILGLNFSKLVAHRYVNSCRNATVHWIEEFSFNALKNWHNHIDFLLIDADHSYDSCLQDWQEWNRFVVPGGIVAFHDARIFEDGWTKEDWGPVIVVKELFRNHHNPQWSIVDEVDSLVIIQRH